MKAKFVSFLFFHFCIYFILLLLPVSQLVSIVLVLVLVLHSPDECRSQNELVTAESGTGCMKSKVGVATRSASLSPTGSRHVGGAPRCQPTSSRLATRADDVTASGKKTPIIVCTLCSFIR